MNKFISSLLSLAILPILAITYEAQTGLGQNWEANRALVEQRVQLIHTNQETGEVYEKSITANIFAISEYVRVLNDALRLYR